VFSIKSNGDEAFNAKKKLKQWSDEAFNAA
jgi:hypothetical protein